MNQQRLMALLSTLNDKHFVTKAKLGKMIHHADADGMNVTHMKFLLRRTCCKIGDTCVSIAPSAESRQLVTCPWTSSCLLGKRMTGKLQLHKTCRHRVHSIHYVICFGSCWVGAWTGKQGVSKSAETLYFVHKLLMSRRAVIQERTHCDRQKEARKNTTNTS
jgi:hypothetical protein